MSNEATVTDNPNGIGIDEAASAFERILSGNGQQDEPEARPAEAGTPEPDEVEAADEAPEVEEEEGQSEDDGEQDEQPAARRYTVKVDGTEVEVDEQELLAGYQRTADYTRKTQALAEQRRAAEAELQSIRAEREQYAQTLPILQQMLQQQMPQNVDWDRLYQEDPLEWVRQRDLFRERQQQLQLVEAEQKRLAEVQQAEQAQQFQQHLAREREMLLEAVPEWKADPDRARREKLELAEWMVKNGYSPEEAGRVTDHRAARDLRKAMAYDKLVAARQAKPVQAAPKALSPGAAQPPQSKKTSEMTRAKQRLAKTGRWQDAADVFKGLL